MSIFTLFLTIIDSGTAGETKLSQETFQEAEPVTGRIPNSFHPYKNTRNYDSYNQNILTNVLCWYGSICLKTIEYEKNPHCTNSVECPLRNESKLLVMIINILWERP